MPRTIDGEQTYYECTECGTTVSAGEVPVHEFEHSPETKATEEGSHND